MKTHPPSKVGAVATVAWASLLALAAAPAVAWENHALGTVNALSELPEIAAAGDVVTESLDSFLLREQNSLAAVLEAEEAWSRKHVPRYPARPEALRFQTSSPLSAFDLRNRFLRAIRVNPSTPLTLFAQQLPGRTIHASGALKPIPFDEVSLLPPHEGQGQNPFVRLEEASSISALDVISTASDEPDYGLDIGLWADNGTEFGRAYGFGDQPFGNATLSFSSQAPFHMGFFHEHKIAYRVAGYLRRTYSEHRIHLYRALSRHAFATGHPYWGWRFAGWGLHYLQDLTMPYHSTALPGVNLGKMIGIGALDMAGFGGPKSRSVQLVTNRHLALENFQNNLLRKGMIQAPGAPTQSALAARLALDALSDRSGDAASGAYSDSSPRDRAAARSHGAASRADSVIRRSLPSRLVDDPSYLFGVTDPHVNVLETLERPGAELDLFMMTGLLTPLMRELGTESRSYVRSISN